MRVPLSLSTLPRTMRARSARAFCRVRDETEPACRASGAEDQTVAIDADASPTKWHRAHTTWFFDSFCWLSTSAGYRAFDERFAFCSL